VRNLLNLPFEDLVDFQPRQWETCSLTGDNLNRIYSITIEILEIVATRSVLKLDPPSYGVQSNGARDRFEVACRTFGLRVTAASRERGALSRQPVSRRMTGTDLVVLQSASGCPQAERPLGPFGRLALRRTHRQIGIVDRSRGQGSAP
jgi:hypothetical protein